MSETAAEQGRWKKYGFLLFSAAAGCVFAVVVSFFPERQWGISKIFSAGTAAFTEEQSQAADGQNGQTEILELTQELYYNEEFGKTLETVREEDIELVLYKEKAGAFVQNKDYNRSVQVKTYGITGSSGVLFPGGNVLAADETGFCILGADTAWELFGSTDIVGRQVTMDEKNYYVAGIEYDEPELFVYELEPSDNAELTHAAYRYQGKKEMERIRQVLEGTYGIAGE